MKKTLIALAALASTAAFAQSVTLSGGVGVAVQNTSAGTQLTQTDGFLKFSVTEDLGGGLSIAASQQIAMKGRGGSVASEDTFTSLSGGFGKVEFNNQNAGSNLVGSLASLASDVNGLMGGDAHLSLARYTAPAIGGVTLSVASYNNQGASGTATTLDTNSIFSSTKYATAYKAAYAAGPLTAAAEYRQHDGRTRVWAGYDLGVAKVDMGTEVSYKDASKKKQTGFGLTVPMGATTLGLHHETKADKGKGTEVAAVYALSKRTNVNLSYGRLTDTANVSTNNTRVRLMHTF
jgi:hypothetical protein